MNFNWGELINQLLNFMLFGGLLWALKKLIEKVDQLGTRLTVLETEHELFKKIGGCPVIRESKENDT